MKIVKTGLVLAMSFAVMAAACSKDEKKGAAASTATSSVRIEKKVEPGKKKLPPKTAAKGDPKKGKKGGDDSAQKPSEKSHHASTATTSSDKKHKVESAADHPCEHAPDGAAECHGSEIVFCAGKELWSLDCNALMTAAHPESFDAGTCYETDGVTDCMGVGVADDLSMVACTSDLGMCCGDDGTCYTTH